MEALQKIYEEHNPQVLTNNNYVVEVLCPEVIFLHCITCELFNICFVVCNPV